MTRPIALPLIVITLAVALASPAAAQPSDQPERATGTRASETFFDVTVDMFGAVDRSLGSADPAADAGDRTYWGGNSEVAYEKSAGRFRIGAAAGASVRRLTNVTEGTIPSYSGSLTLAGPLTRRTSWDLFQSLGYGPTNAVAFFGPGDPIEGVQSALPLVDYRLSDNDQLTSSTRGGLSYLISRRGSLSGFAGIDRAGAPASPDETSNAAFRRWTVGGRYSYRMTRYLSWYAGYGLTENSVSSDSASTELVGAPRMHNIDSGVSYGRPLSFSRKTRVESYLGSSIVEDRATRERQWRANGSASLSHELGRTWTARLAYYRDTSYLPAFADPVMSDAVSLGFAGQLSEKASVDAVLNYATGKVGLAEGGNNGYRLAAASTGFRYAFFEQLAAYVEYFLFDASFDSDVTLSESRIRESQRHGLRVGISIGTGSWGNRRRGMVRTGDGESTR